MEDEIITVTDAHNHVFPNKIAEKSKVGVSEFYDLPMYTVGTEKELKRIHNEIFTYKNKKYKIGTQLICSPAVTPKQTQSINSFISKLVKRNSNFIGFGTLHPSNENKKEIIDNIIADGLKGIKLHSDFQQFYINDKKAYPIYEYAEEKNIPILFHMGDKKSDYSNPEYLKDVIRDFPNLKITAAHMGGYSAWERAYTLPKVENLYFDISSTLSFITKDMLCKFIEKFGYEHFFFGSDFPMWNPYSELKILIDYNLDEKIFKAITKSNFEKFIS